MISDCVKSKVGAKWSKLKSGAQQKVVKAAEEEKPRRGCQNPAVYTPLPDFSYTHKNGWEKKKKSKGICLDNIVSR